MQTLLIALLSGVGFLVAYHTYGRWLGRRVFAIDPNAVTPALALEDGVDYVPTSKAVVFGHHFTSIAGTGPIVGPAIAVMWGWLPALLWVVFGSIFIGAVHDFGSLVVSLRNNGQTVGDIAGRVLNRRARLLFLFILVMALTIVLAIFGMVIAAVFRQYPASIFPCTVQIPIAVGIGYWLHRRGAKLFWPSLIALAVMYLTVVFGDENFATDLPVLQTVTHLLHGINAAMAAWPTWVWVLLLLGYSYVASVLPVWVLLQPRDYINSLQLISAMGLIVVGLVAAACVGGAPPVEGAPRPPLEIVAPVVQWNPAGAPVFIPFLFITIACGAISGFHCLVSSGTSSKQLRSEADARFVGYGGMLTEGFLATIVILACVAGLGLGVPLPLTHWTRPDSSGWNYHFIANDGRAASINIDQREVQLVDEDGGLVTFPFEMDPSGVATSSTFGFVFNGDRASAISQAAWNTRYPSWGSAGGLGRTVAAFVDGSSNLLGAVGIPAGIAVALMGVLVASFAGTTMDTACRLQRYVIQELAATFAPAVSPTACAACGYDLCFNVTRRCPECGSPVEVERMARMAETVPGRRRFSWNPLVWLTNKHGATVAAIVSAAIIAFMPAAPTSTSFWSAAAAGDLAGVVDWLNRYAGLGGLILWPLFGATNQLLGGLTFLVIAFYLWRRELPVWFLAVPMAFMLLMPLLALVWQMFVGNEDHPSWWSQGRWLLLAVGVVTLALEVWMIAEAALMFPKVKGVLERRAPELQARRRDYTEARHAVGARG